MRTHDWLWPTQRSPYHLPESTIIPQQHERGGHSDSPSIRTVKKPVSLFQCGRPPRRGLSVTRYPYFPFRQQAPNSGKSMSWCLHALKLTGPLVSDQRHHCFVPSTTNSTTASSVPNHAVSSNASLQSPRNSIPLSTVGVTASSSGSVISSLHAPQAHPHLPLTALIKVNPTCFQSSPHQ